MRITKIELKDFKAFRGEYKIDLHAAGHNLLVYGENGSGKSSLLQAINLFINAGLLNNSFGVHQNIFVAGSDGYVKLTLGPDDEAEAGIYEWSETSSPYGKGIVIEAAKTCGFLDYRALLETHFVYRLEDKVDIFDLLVNTLLAQIINPISRRSFAEDWALVESGVTAKRLTGIKLETLTKNLNDFNTGLLSILPELAAKANEILTIFDLNTDIGLETSTIGIGENPKRLTGKSILLRANYYGQGITRHHLFLNEARLSAVAVSLYLAALLLQPSSRLNLLVLDDVLIGLDMSNRLPVLDILHRYFADYQIFLATYDRAWYEIVRQRTQGEKWETAEFLLGRTDEFDFPIHHPRNSYFNKTQKHLDDGDLKAAVIYLRTGFEDVIRGFCDKKRLSIRYCRIEKKLTTEDFWAPIKNGRGRDGVLYVDPALAHEIELYRTLVLNPISHAATVNPIRREVEAALDTIKRLNAVLNP